LQFYNIGGIIEASGKSTKTNTINEYMASCKIYTF